MNVRDHVVVLVGGVGGAKLAVGLANALPPEALTVIVNTADDFEHLGLHVSPDLDTVMYSLAGLAHPVNGWGIDGDTFHAMAMVARYGGPEWFRLGDRDLGTNLIRTMLLREGRTLTEVTRQLATTLGVRHSLLPMSDQAVRTWLDTDRGRLAFQEYFVRERWQPVVSSLEFVGASEAQPTSEVVKALQAASLVLFAPSNPFLSLDPILAVPGIRERIAESAALRIGVSPIIGGQAVKGPAAKLMSELGLDVSPGGIAVHYRDLLDALVIDEADRAYKETIAALGICPIEKQTLLQTLFDKINLAKSILSWAEEQTK